MNTERIKKAIELFSKIPSTSLRMSRFYNNLGNPHRTLSEAKRSCGTTACFAGWVGLSQDFKKAGGYIKDTGLFAFIYEPMLPGCSNPMQSMAKYFDIDSKTADKLCGYNTKGSYYHNTNPIYGVRNSEVTPNHVVEALTKLLKGDQK